MLARASLLSLGGLVLAALPAADRILAKVPQTQADIDLADATLQAIADTLVPGRPVTATGLGDPVHPQAIAGVHDEPGAVEADALLLFHSALVGFDALQPAFLAEVSARSLLHGGAFLDLSFAERVAVVAEGLDASDPAVLLWEAAVAVVFGAFVLGAAQREPEIDAARSSGLVGFPGAAPRGYADLCRGRRLARELAGYGNLP